MTSPKQIAMRLTRLRKARKLSQYALAAEAKISREYLRKLEAGLSDPTVGMLTRLAKALGVPITDLLELDVKKPGGRS